MNYAIPAAFANSIQSLRRDNMGVVILDCLNYCDRIDGILVPSDYIINETLEFLRGISATLSPFSNRCTYYVFLLRIS